MSNPLFHAYAFDDAFGEHFGFAFAFHVEHLVLGRRELPQLRTNIIIWFVVLFETLCLAGGDSH